MLSRVLRSGLLVLAVAAAGVCWSQGSTRQGGLQQGAGPSATQGNNSAASTRWVTVRGQATDLAINPKGDVFALDSEGRLWRLPADEAKSGGSGWLTQPGRFKRIRATHDGTMWAIDFGDALYRLQGSVWKPVISPVRDIAAAPDGQALILTSDGKLFDVQSETAFSPAPPDSASPASTLVVDAHGLPWLQREDRSVVRFDGTTWQNVASAKDRLAMVTAGFDGGILGIAADGQIARYDPRRNAWQTYVTLGQVVPPMRQLALSPIGLPWGISQAGELMAERPIGAPPPPVASPSVFTRLLTWQNTGGPTSLVGVGQDGTVYTVAPDGSVWRRRRGNQWLRTPVEGQIKAIASGTEGRAWGINDKGGISQFDSGFQTALPTPGQVRLIASGPKGTLWAVTVGDELHRWNAVGRQWERVMKLPAPPVSITIGVRSEPWFIDAKGSVRTQNQSGEWIAIPGIHATSVSVGPDGTVYATSKEEGVYWLDAREMRWKPASGKAVLIAVGPGGAPWAVSAKNELLVSGRVPDEPAPRETTQTASRTSPTTPSTSTPSDASTTTTQKSTTQSGSTTGAAIVVGSTSGFTVTAPKSSTIKPLSYQTIVSDARFNDVGIGSNGTVFAASTDGGLMCFSNAANRFVLASSGTASRVAVAPDGTPWILDTNGRVSRFDKSRSAWRTVPNFTGVDISFGPDGQLWGVSSGGAVFRFNVGSDSFDPELVVTSDVSFRAKRVAGANTRVYWAISEQSQLVRCEKGDCRVVLVGATDAAVAPDNTLFALDVLGNVQRYDAVKKVFEKQNGTGGAIAVGPGGLPWLVTSAGKIDSSGIFAATSKTINAPDCATVFAAAPAPLPPPPSVALAANADSATLAPGASLNLLANDTFSGRAANIADVTVSLENSSSLLALSGGTVVVASAASAGAVLTGTYKICPRNVTGNCVSSTVSVTVSGVTTAPTGVAAVAGNGNATVSFTAPAGFAGVTISSYTVTSTPGSVSVTGAASPITISGLTNGTAYSFTVTVRYSNGITKTSDATVPVTPTAVTSEPSAPTIGTAVAGNAQATVSFAVPSSNGGSAITGYTVTANPGGKTATGTTSPITVTGLSNGTAYTFTVRAQNAIGLGAASSASNTVTPTAVTAPGIPTIGTATAGNASATVAFTAPASTGGSAITSYTATSFPGSITGTGAASPITVTGLTNGTAYTFTITATNAIGTSLASAASNSVTPVGATVPGAPTAVSAIVAGPGALQVTFTAPASDGGSAITAYTATSAPGALTGNNPASPIVVGGLTGGTSYTFTVTATNGVGTGPASAASVGVTAQDVPGAPTGLADCGSGAGTICLSWGAPVSNGGSAITQYTVACMDMSIPAPIPPFVTAGLTANLGAGEGVVGGNTYQCQVGAENAAFPGLPGPPAGPVTSFP